MAPASPFRVVFVGLMFVCSAIAARADRTIKLVHPLTPAMRAAAEYFFLHDPEGMAIMRDSDLKPEVIDEMSGAMADIDGDGVDEVFLLPPNDSLSFRPRFGVCGSAGCYVWILKKDGER